MTDFDSTDEWTEPADDEIRAIRDYFDHQEDRAIKSAPSPLFTGRKTVAQGVERDLCRLRESKGPIDNLTRVVYGAPGAGKSEILVQMAARFSRWTEGDSRVLPVWANAASLTDPGVLGAAVYEAAKERPDRNRTRLAGVEAGASVGVAKASLRFERSVRQPAVPLWQIAHAINRDFNHPTILFLVDEAQAELEDALGARGPKLARLMHKGEMAGLKILPVYGGLGDTLKKLADAGVSRPSASRVHLLGSLDRDDARKMCETGLRALAGASDPTALEGWARRIAKKADAWPMHIVHCLGAVRERQKARAGFPLDDSDFDRAMRDAGKRRAFYYGRRLDGCPALSPKQYVRWVGMFEDEEAEVARHQLAEALDLSETDAEALVDQAVHAGLLEPVPEGGAYISPIPSLLTHMADRGRASVRPRRGRGGR